MLSYCSLCALLFSTSELQIHFSRISYTTLFLQKMCKKLQILIEIAYEIPTRLHRWPEIMIGRIHMFFRVTHWGKNKNKTKQKQAKPPKHCKMKKQQRKLKLEMHFGWNQVGVSCKHPSCNLTENITLELNRCQWCTVKQCFFKNWDCYSLLIYLTFSQIINYTNRKTILLNTYYPIEHV